MIATTVVPKAGKNFRITPGERIAVGVDTHKRTYAVSLWGINEDTEIKHWTQPADPHALMRTLEPYREQIAQVAYEAGPTGFVLARALAGERWPVLVASPADIMSSRNAGKSDRLDARRLARLCAKGLLDGCFIPSAAQDEERRMVRIRGRILADKVRIQLRIKSMLLCHGLSEPPGLKNWSQAGMKQLRELPCSADLRFCLELLATQLEQTKQLLRICDRQLSKLAQRSQHKKDIEILTSIPGIGTPSALQFLVEMGPVGRFESRLYASKYQGLSPEVRQTGQTRCELDLNNSGNRRLRTLLVEATWRWIGYDTNARALYDHMIRNTGFAQKAIVAVARKLGILMWHLRERQTSYDTTKLATKPQRR